MARTKLTDLYQSLNDKPLIYENVETLQVKLGGDEKTELKITNQTDNSGMVDLSNVTLEFKGEKYEGLEFKLEEILEDHDNEGKDALFVAETEDTKFEVEVNIEADYDMSNRIQDVEWRSLETFPKEDKGESLDERKKAKRSKRDLEKIANPDDWTGEPNPDDINEAHCTEQEIAEGTCGYGMDGELGDEPAGPHLFMLEDEDIDEIKAVGNKGGLDECTRHEDCHRSLTSVSCCRRGKCVPCEGGEKFIPSKSLNESIKKRLQKLANIK